MFASALGSVLDSVLFASERKVTPRSEKSCDARSDGILEKNAI